jgi:hypothetical protein
MRAHMFEDADISNFLNERAIPKESYKLKVV